MKKIIFLLLMASTTSLYAQTLSASAGLERTVAALESQFTMGYLTKKQWSLGTFYQSTLSVPPFEITIEKNTCTWYGAYINVPIAKSEKITFYAQLRTGLINEKFIAVVPSLETKVKVTKRFAFGVGSSYRQGYPALSFKAHINIFNQSAL